MNNHHAWEREYRNPQFISCGNNAIQDVKQYITWLRKKQNVSLTDAIVLDLGCGAGKNSLYCNERGARVIGYDISPTAIALAQQRVNALDNKVSAEFFVQSIGKPFPLPDASVTIVFDSMSSHALSFTEREVYLRELYRVLVPGGHVFVRTFVLDGDDNAKYLLKNHKGTEQNTYMLPETGMQEHVYTEKELREFYADFDVLYNEKVFGYQRFKGRSYKRRYMLLYLQKKLA